MKKKILVTAFLLIFIALIGGFFIYQNSSYAESSLSDVAFSRDSHKIVLTNVNRRGENGTLILRLTDGEDQFFPGDFNFSYGNDRRLYVFGDVQLEDRLKRVLYVVNELDGIKEVDASDVGGPISKVIESPDGNYIIIRFEVDGVSEHCISERDIDGNLKCDRYASTENPDVIWHPEKPHHTLFRAAQKIREIDQWSPDPTTYRQDENPDEYQKLDDFFNADNQQTSWTDGIYSIGVGHVAFPYERTTWMPYFIPGSGVATWIYNYDHILVKTDTSLSLYALSSKKVTPLVEGQDLSDSVIHTDIRTLVHD